jgi:type IV pilus assembly protein PilC
MATFNRQLADLLSSGIPLVKALSVIQNQTPNPQLIEVITQITQDVSGGDSLAGAMSKHPKIFSKLYVAMVRSGEAGGLLDQVLQRLADFAESEAETRSKIKSALAYPLVMVVAGTGAVVVLMTVVMPKILKIYSDLNQTLPVTTQFLILLSDSLRNYWYMFIGTIIALVFAFRRTVATAEGKRALDALVIRIPVLGPMIVKKEIANFARTLGSLLHNGVSILSALEITIEVLTNRTVQDEVAQIPLNVTQGEGIAAPLRKSKVFPPVVVNMMAIGEETGRLDDVLMKIARSFDTEVDRGMKTLTSLLEPMVILVMGVVVGFIVISMLLPIFSIDPGT